MTQINLLDLGVAIPETEDPDDIIKPNKVERLVLPGDVWKLGEHFVICGDATSPADLDRLLGGERPNVWGYKLTEKYDEVFQSNIIGFNYPKNYDLIIFGDVLEHMTVKEAQFVISEARKHADRILVAVPFLYEQGEKGGNPFEVHKQDDLTHEIFMERYPGFEPIYMIDGYAYYVNEV